MDKKELDDLVERVGGLIQSGRTVPDVGYQAIGAVAAWKGGFHDIALAELSDEFILSIEQTLTTAGVEIPWPPHSAPAQNDSTTPGDDTGTGAPAGS